MGRAGWRGEGWFLGDRPRLLIPPGGQTYACARAHSSWEVGKVDLLLRWVKGHDTAEPSRGLFKTGFLPEVGWGAGYIHGG